ncbi:MAG TPA: serine hydrolase [Puia sp.]|nr:serine hydrolase [Puia sp.]
MKKILMFLLAMVLIRATLAQSLNQELDSVMHSYQRVHRFNGTVLVAKNGSVLLEKGYGYSDFRTAKLNGAQSVYMIASMTKQFTAAVVLKLVAENRIKISDPISKFFPAYANGNHITIYHLLTHTSGIPDYPRDSIFMASHKKVSVSEALLQYDKSDFAPGTEWRYSNVGYQLLGEIIAKVTGMSYFEAVRRYIFYPLGMTHSGFDFVGLKSNAKTTGYWSWPEKNNAEEAIIIDSSASSAAGAIYSTVGDLYKWHQALQDYRIIPKKLLDQAYTPFKNHYGFGWFADSLYGRRILSHSGDTWGFKSNIARVTEDDVCVILLNNIEDEEMRGAVTNDVLAVLYRRPYHLPVFHEEISLGDKILKNYVGNYQLQGFTMTISLDSGRLWATPQGQEASRIYPEKENLFFSRVVDAELEFVTDDRGQISSVIIKQGGHEMKGEKVH